jgi:diguanylate cyclase (GGDEF)-like protein
MLMNDARQLSAQIDIHCGPIRTDTNPSLQGGDPLAQAIANWNANVDQWIDTNHDVVRLTAIKAVQTNLLTLHRACQLGQSRAHHKVDVGRLQWQLADSMNQWFLSDPGMPPTSDNGFDPTRAALLAAVTCVMALCLGMVLYLKTRTSHRRSMTAVARMEELSRTDPLTGIHNRRGLDDTLRIEMARARRHQTRLAIVMIDLDFFKRYNSLRGHAGGDALLRDSARAWVAQLRPTDSLARYGGEEFTLVLPDCSIAQAMILIERLRRVVPDSQTFSAGVARWDGHESGPQLLDRADQALMDAKHAGRNRAISADNDAQIGLDLPPLS